MAESSIFWTTGSTGDGASAYTQTQVTDWLRRTFINDNTTEGVLYGYKNALSFAGTSSPVAINTGAAMVYGFPYENTASVNVAIPTPVIGTTGHRIVLRASWAAQTVRITLISSSDGVASIPAATQTAGTTWDITLATLTITTGGVISLTDVRSYCHANLKVNGSFIDDATIATAKIADSNITTAKIADSNVTTAKIADANVTTAKIASDAVDDTKVGNRVPQFYRRQGGSGTDWTTAGTSTQIPTTVRMQAGVVVSANSDSGLGQTGTATVTFPVAFSNKPLVFTEAVNSAVVVTSVTSISATQCTITWQVSVSGYNVFLVDLKWFAIGPE